MRNRFKRAGNIRSFPLFQEQDDQCAAGASCPAVRQGLYPDNDFVN